MHYHSFYTFVTSNSKWDQILIYTHIMNKTWKNKIREIQQHGLKKISTLYFIGI